MRRVGARHAVQDHVALVGVAAIPGEESLHAVAVDHDHAGSQHDLRHVIEVAHRDEIFELVNRANRDRQRHDHREAGVNRAGDKIGWKDCRVPARDHRHREVETDHGVHRNHQRRRQPRQQQVGDLVAIPMDRRPPPTHRQNAVDDLRPAVGRAIAQGGEVGNQSHEPEHRRNRRVGRHGEHVPHQWAAKLRPHTHRVGVGEQPISQPRPSEVDQREDPRASHREQSHRLGETVDRRTPVLLEQQQDGRDQRARVADADPPDEVDDRETPAHGNVQAPNARPAKHQHGDRIEQHHHQREADAQPHVPQARRAAGEHDAADLLADRAVGVPALDHSH